MLFFLCQVQYLEPVGSQVLLSTFIPPFSPLLATQQLPSSKAKAKRTIVSWGPEALLPANAPW